MVGFISRCIAPLFVVVLLAEPMPFGQLRTLQAISARENTCVCHPGTSR